MTALKTRLIGLAGCLAILLLVIGMPSTLIAIDAVPRPSDFGWSQLTAPDDGTLALVLISGVAWIAWAVMVVSLGAEAVGRLRGGPPLRLPGLAVPQLAAGRLIAVAALLFVSAPLTPSLLGTPPAAGVAPPVPSMVAPPAASPAPAVSVPQQSPDPTPTQFYTVKRGDSLWRIAEEHLGDGTRYGGIVALNRDVLNGQPDFITPGLILRIPDERANGEAYVVQPGDTLSEIAERELGEASAYPEIFVASQDTVQPDGRQLGDPNLILPGWKLTLPSQVRTNTSESEQIERDAEPGRLPTPRVVPDPSSQDSSPDTARAGVDETSGSATPGWALVGLTGAGAVLAGSMLLVLRQQRRTQRRYRTPGHVLVPPPAELLDVDKTAHLTGTVSAPRVDVLDRALRQLATISSDVPRLSTVELSADKITLHLTEAAYLPAPWAGEQAAWSLDLSADIQESSGDVAPYPLLVSIGMDDAGSLVLVNLEEVRTVAITGDPERAAALGRHLTAELSLSPWSTLVEVDTIGIAGELADMDPSRHHHHPETDDGFLDELASGLEAEDPALEPDQFRVVIASSGDAQHDALRKVVASYPGRAGAAIVTISLDPVDSSSQLSLDAEGRLTGTELGLTLTAAGLTAEDAVACSTLIDLTRDIPEETIPPLQPDGATTVGGGLAPALTEPRPQGPAGDRSLLPLSATEYAEVAATTREDVDLLAPVVSESTQEQVSESDPDLDEEVARWQSPHLMGPKLTLLGPVSARTLGDARRMAHRRPFYIELLSFLALRPNGATADEIGTAFGIQPERARKDLGILRGWLGTDKRTGKPHLPNARQTHVKGEGARYVLSGVATDLDLFRRLRARGQSRGAAGIDDLQTALTLVSGETFSDLRPTGWSWLFEGERLDHIMSCAIVDTAHIVTTQALSVGDLDLARFAAETGNLACPYDETSRLDLVAVRSACGEDEAAERLLADAVLDRSDDGLGPLDTPAHTSRIVRQRGWATSRSRSAG
ncbi:LysM peptidoglycan-binding domain-containing protein [Nocardioides seonyuensis]|uniref:LysM peptidoglycan-binding domain-containing protein n=1 Tax=Nocardioides seonyuensis TaxID=2518371 RepID=A0A4P7IKD5_9ACTN|nr:LysM peptidoglycan-binding domain-containing protein [Nocardioides seonyuensis]QBX57290.1 LysM peptidoglycan-binding domain-containing protein [Nocardioides seonyuensis]